MATQISSEQFTDALLAVLTEAFENVRGYFLDPGTSIFETLAGISAEEASIPVGGKCATLAAQVEHVNFYLEVLEQYLKTGENARVDWGEVWRTVSTVNADAWAASQARLRDSYGRIREQIRAYDHWEQPDEIAGAIGLAAHCAYHLGEIRQALCTLRK